MATNTTDPEILGWVQEPDGRGSFSILKSCVITLVLCVYTALHLNVPPANSTKIFLIWRKTKWILIGLFAPEIVVFVAWAQKQQVKKFSKDIAVIFAEQAEKDPSLKRKHEWTTTHSWFAYMGGFAIDITYGQEDLPCEYDPRWPRTTFLSKALLILARAGFLPDISRKSILDKSKADAIAKVLVVTQATWMILQCVMRLANKLPLTTLELTTLAHAICALLTYVFWWEKLLDVAEPILMTGDWAPGFASTLWACSARCFNHVGYWIDQASAECLKDSCSTAPAPGDISAALPSYSITVIDLDTKRKTTYDLTSREHIRIKQGQFVIADILGTTVLWPKAPPLRNKTFGHLVDQEWNIGLHTLVRWQLLRRFISDYPDVANQIFESPEIVPYGGSSPDNLFITKDFILEEMRQLTGQDTRLTMRYLGRKNHHRHLAIGVVSNWTGPNPGLSDTYTMLQSMTVFFIAALAYGAVHAAAWNGHFASQNEALLWKISCIYITGCGCLAMALLMARERFKSLDSYLRKDYSGSHIPSKWDVVWEYITGIESVLFFRARTNFFIPVIFYLFCRAYLVVEGFIGLRSLPAEAFQTPDWTQYLPHL
ncbi:hypothetical protein QBC37DRAFT_458824 [Rhypophila decipiens]|uniref:Uncharacterized protein n=1 Tax=Rhypophila decipiens TaxID=261697 RepID=A0AAN6XVL2_9PEZI|nr:hypothetical protein QBC37DRAFT_458824 [Rhypophila decipiens]